MEKISDGVNITSRGLSVFVSIGNQCMIGRQDDPIIEIKPNDLLDGFVSRNENYSNLEEAVDAARSILQTYTP
jgi:hypothetical protein